MMVKTICRFFIKNYIKCINTILKGTIRRNDFKVPIKIKAQKYSFRYGERVKQNVYNEIANVRTFKCFFFILTRL